MGTNEMMKMYDDYLENHISCVKKSFDWLYENIPEIFEGYDSDYLGDLISRHDESKYYGEEYVPYCSYFYGERTDFVEEEFNLAWLHHIHTNKHHWQHWVLINDDDGTVALEMPFIYVIEMLCDHWSFSWKSGNLMEIFDWYDKHKDGMILNDSTRGLYESILHKIKNKLSELVD